MRSADGVRQAHQQGASATQRLDTARQDVADAQDALRRAEGLLDTVLANTETTEVLAETTEEKDA